MVSVGKERIKDEKELKKIRSISGCCCADVNRSVGHEGGMGIKTAH